VVSLRGLTVLISPVFHGLPSGTEKYCVTVLRHQTVLMQSLV
jgi:hypothetical protein